MDFLNRIVRIIQSDNISRQGTTGFAFEYTCIDKYIEDSITEFEFEFEELGMKFTNEYSIYEIINILFYERYEKSIIKFEESKTQNNFHSLLDAYSWLLYAMIIAKDKNKILPSEFFQDIVLSALFSYCYYPKLLPEIIEYLKLHYKIICKEWREKDFKVYYGYSNVFQLLLLILKSEESYDLSDFRSVDVEPNYQFILNNILSEEENTVQIVYDKLTHFHISDKGEDYLDVFNHNCWKYLPVEIFAFMIFRERNNIATIQPAANPLIENFLPFIFTEKPLPVEELSKKLERKIR